MDKNDKILKKIKKCLALSKSSNAHEAAIALKQAQALMEEYNLSQTDVVFSDVNEHRSNSQSSEKRPNWDHYLINVVKSAFGCHAFIDVEYKMFKSFFSVSFVGIGVSSELAAYTYNVLKRQLLKVRTNYSNTALKRIVRKNKIARADQFCMGWVYEVEKQVYEFANPEHKELLQEYLTLKHPHLVKSKTINREIKRGNGADDALAGAIAAEGVQLHRPVNGQSHTSLEYKA